MWNAIRCLFQSSPFWVISQGDYQELENRLDNGVSPDLCKLGQSLLTTALRHRQVALATLLLQRGANPNLNVSARPGKKFSALYIAYCEFDSPALLKLMLTYGTKWDYLKDECINQTDTLLEFLRKIETGCYHLYHLLQNAESLLKSKDYDTAQEKFSEANRLLKAFAEEEQKGLNEEEKLSEQKKVYKSNIAFVNDYLYRSRICEEKIIQCQKALKEKNPKEGKDVQRLRSISEFTPLLNGTEEEWKLENLRKRKHSSSAPASCSSTSTQASKPIIQEKKESLEMDTKNSSKKSCFDLGEKEFEGRHYEMAYGFYQEAADQGDSRAIRVLGQYHYFGYQDEQKKEIVKKDMGEAKRCFEEAAKLGDSLAQNWLNLLQAEDAKNNKNSLKQSPQ